MRRPPPFPYRFRTVDPEPDYDETATEMVDTRRYQEPAEVLDVTVPSETEWHRDLTRAEIPDWSPSDPAPTLTRGRPARIVRPPETRLPWSRDVALTVSFVVIGSAAIWTVALLIAIVTALAMPIPV